MQATLSFSEKLHKEIRATDLVELSEALYASGMLVCDKTVWYESLGEFIGVSLKNHGVIRSHILNRVGSPTMFLDKIATNFNEQVQKGLEKK